MGRQEIEKIETLGERQLEKDFFFVNKMAWDWYYKLKHSLLNAELNSRIKKFYVPFTQFAVGVIIS